MQEPTESDIIITKITDLVMLERMLKIDGLWRLVFSEISELHVELVSRFIQYLTLRAKGKDFKRAIIGNDPRNWIERQPV